MNVSGRRGDFCGQVYLHFALRAPADLVLSYAWLERVKTTTTGTN